MVGAKFTDSSGSLLGIDPADCHIINNSASATVSGDLYLQWNTYSQTHFGESDPMFMLYDISGATKGDNGFELTSTGEVCKMWARFNYNPSYVWPLGTIGNYIEDSDNSGLSDTRVKALDAFGLFYKQGVIPPIQSMSFA